MAEKALFIGPIGLVKRGASWLVRGSCNVTNGNDGTLVYHVIVSTTTLDPVQHGLKVKFKNAIVAAAAADGIVVDEVIFPDLSVLSA